MTNPDRREIAERIRALVVDQSGIGVQAMALRLGVDEQALHKSIDDILPDPTLDVLVAIVRELGVDPTWLLTGGYVPATHQRALESDREGIATLLKELLRRESPTAGVPIADAELTPDFTAETRIEE